jgi:hypothetical protein
VKSGTPSKRARFTAASALRMLALSSPSVNTTMAFAGADRA